MRELPHVNDVAPEDHTAWYREYWIRVAIVAGAGFLLGLGLLLYLVVTRPIIKALEAL